VWFNLPNLYNDGLEYFSGVIRSFLNGQGGDVSVINTPTFIKTITFDGTVRNIITFDNTIRETISFDTVG